MIQGVAAERVNVAVTLAKGFVRANRDAAVVVLGTPDEDNAVFVAFDYWDWPTAFEAKVGDQGRASGCDGATFVTPLIVLKNDFTQARQAIGEPAGADEDHVLWIFTFDLDEGYDIARCLYTPDGADYQFADVEVLAGDTQVTPETPGFDLLRALLPTSD